jgi:hypothetical protein
VTWLILGMCAWMLGISLLVTAMVILYTVRIRRGEWRGCDGWNERGEE